MTPFLPLASRARLLNSTQDGEFRETGKREENHLKSLLAQGSPKESWEICKVHAGIVVRGLRTKSSCSPSAYTSPFSALPHLPLRLTARMSPRMGAAPHSTVATTTGSGKAARCMAAGREKMRKRPPDSRRRSGVLRPLRPSRIPGVQSPPGPTSSYMGARGRDPDSGSEIFSPFSEARRETLNVSFPDF